LFPLITQLNLIRKTYPIVPIHIIDQIGIPMDIGKIKLIITTKDTKITKVFLENELTRIIQENFQFSWIIRVIIYRSMRYT